MLWIALHLPLLSLESFVATLPHEAGAQALALTDGHKIVSVNAAARASGVKPGLKRATALALAPQLVLGQASAARDDQALVAVAHAALAFTPIVVIPEASGAVGAPAPHTVLLDVQGSRRYFGGLKRLVQRLHAALAPLGHVLHTGIAPTALGVKPGLKRATALALAPQLVMGQADALRDAQALTAVAHAALAFTPDRKSVV